MGDEANDKLASVTLQFPRLDHKVVIIFDRSMAAEIREQYPDAAIWSADAFKRFMDDARRHPSEKRGELLAGVSLVKSVLGGTYEGMRDGQSDGTLGGDHNHGVGARILKTI